MFLDFGELGLDGLGSTVLFQSGRTSWFIFSGWKLLQYVNILLVMIGTGKGEDFLQTPWRTGPQHRNKGLHTYGSAFSRTWRVLGSETLEGEGELRVDVV